MNLTSRVSCSLDFPLLECPESLTSSNGSGHTPSCSNSILSKVINIHTFLNSVTLLRDNIPVSFAHTLHFRTL